MKGWDPTLYFHLIEQPKKERFYTFRRLPRRESPLCPLKGGGGNLMVNVRFEPGVRKKSRPFNFLLCGGRELERGGSAAPPSPPAKGKKALCLRKGVDRA